MLLLLQGKRAFTQVEDARGAVAKAKTSPDQKGTTRAVIVGLTPSGINDAKLFKRYLIEVAHVPQDQVNCLTGPEAGAKNTYAALKSMVVAAQPGDMLYFYFSGDSRYSDFFEESESLLLTAQAIPGDTHMGAPGILPLGDVIRLLDKAASRKVSIRYIVDTNKAKDSAANARKNLETLQARTQKNQLFLAAAPGMQSYCNPDSQLGYFTYYLILGLSGAADLNADDQVSYSEIDDFLYDNLTAVTGGKQMPLSPALPGEIMVSLKPGDREKALQKLKKTTVE